MSNRFKTKPINYGEKWKNKNLWNKQNEKLRNKIISKSVDFAVPTEKNSQGISFFGSCLKSIVGVTKSIPVVSRPPDVLLRSTLKLNHILVMLQKARKTLLLPIDTAFCHFSRNCLLFLLWSSWASVECHFIRQKHFKCKIMLL